MTRYVYDYSRLTLGAIEKTRVHLCKYSNNNSATLNAVLVQAEGLFQ